MNNSKRKRGFTLIELIVVMSVLMIVLAIILTAARELKFHSNMVFCMNNLRQISVALVTYYNDHRDYPHGLPYDTLNNQLSRYLSSGKVFVCPQDYEESDDSYSPFYTYPGDDSDGSQYIIGCPRHKRGSMCTAIFGFQNAQKAQVAEVTVDDVPVTAGATYSGKFDLEDGTTVSSNSIEMQLVQSIRLSNGSLYTVIRVPDGETGSVTVDAVTGTQLEIITPALIAAVRGTSYTINVSYNDGKPVSDITVHDGIVEVQPINGFRTINGELVAVGRRGMQLKPGESTSITSKPPKVNVEAINRRIENLQRKIKRGIGRGEDMSKDISMCNWLMSFGSQPGQFFDPPGQGSAPSFPARYETASAAKQGAQTAYTGANREKDKAETSKHFIENVARDVSQKVGETARDADAAERARDTVTREIGKNKFDKAAEAANDALQAARLAEDKVLHINQQMETAQQAKMNADRAYVKSQELAQEAQRAAGQAEEIAQNDPTQTGEAQQARQQAQQALREAQEAQAKADAAAAQYQAAQEQAELARQNAQRARTVATEAAQLAGLDD